MFVPEILGMSTDCYPSIMLFWCWASVADGGPTPNQHWGKVLCQLGCWYPIITCTNTTLTQHTYPASVVYMYSRIQTSGYHIMIQFSLRVHKYVLRPHSLANRTFPLFSIHVTVTMVKH